MSQNPHDALVRAVLGQPEHARGVLRAIVPPAVASAVDWSRLTLQPGSFVDVGQVSRHTDLLYAVRWRAGGVLRLYLLFEHQSTPPTEGLMAHRLLRYMGRIWDRWRTEHPTAAALPTILPIVLYHGTAAWSEPRAFDALLDAPAAARPALGPYLVRFEYLLHDLSAISDEELRTAAGQTAVVRLMELCLKHAWAGAGLLEVLRRGMDVVREVVLAPNGLEALAQVIRYILEVAEIEEAALQELLNRGIGPETKDTVMTTAQRLIEKGRQEGRQDGRQEILLRQLRRRFGAAVDAGVEARVSKATGAEIETWSDRVLSASTLDEIFAS